MDETFYTIEEVAEKLRVQYKTLWRQIHNKIFVCYKIAGVYRITDAQIETYLKQRTTPKVIKRKTPNLI